MSKIISRTKAKQLTLLYQVTAVVCLLGAVAIGVVGLPESAATARINSVSQPPTPPVPGVNIENATNPGQETNQRAQTRIDPGSIAARLAMLDNAPETSKIPNEILAVDTDTTPVENTGSLAKRVRYTGYINDSDKPLAFIRIDGTQRIVAEGGIAKAGSMGLDDLTIKGVRPKFILVTDGQVEDRIKLAAKTGPSVTMSSGAEIIAAKPTREADVVLSPEELEQLSKMPARQRAMQERIMRNKKLGREVPSFERQPLASFRASAGNNRKKEQPDNE